MGCGGGCSQSHWPSSNRPRLRGVNGVFADAPLFEGVLKGILSGQSASKTGGLGSHVMRGGRVLSPGFRVVGFITTSVTAPRLHFCLELDPCPSHLPGLQQDTRPDLGARVRSGPTRWVMSPHQPRCVSPQDPGFASSYSLESLNLQCVYLYCVHYVSTWCVSGFWERMRSPVTIRSSTCLRCW
jgi:hypothetical protein